MSYRQIRGHGSYQRLVDFGSDRGLYRPCTWIRVSNSQMGAEYIPALGSEYWTLTRARSTVHAFGSGYQTLRRARSTSLPLDPGIGSTHGHGAHSCLWIPETNPHTSTEYLSALGSGYRTHERARSIVNALGSEYQTLRRARSTSLSLDPGIGPSHEPRV